MESKHTQGELLQDGHYLYILKEDAVSRIKIAQVTVQEWGITVHNTPKIDHEGIANAVRLMQAWNSHDKLMDALRIAADSFRNAASVTGNKAYDEVAFEIDTLLHQLNT